MPRNPPKLRMAYDTFPVTLSIISRSIWPIMSPFGRRTAVPSTRSLAINGWGLVMTSGIITLPRGLVTRITPERRAGSSLILNLRQPPFPFEHDGCRRRLASQELLGMVVDQERRERRIAVAGSVAGRAVRGR